MSARRDASEPSWRAVMAVATSSMSACTDGREKETQNWVRTSSFVMVVALQMDECSKGEPDSLQACAVGSTTQ